jgi:hypothetical protein
MNIHFTAIPAKVVRGFWGTFSLAVYPFAAGKDGFQARFVPLFDEVVSVHKVGYFADRPCIFSPKGCENAFFKEVCP